MYNTGLFIFHRDLRIQDNLGLLEALKSCSKVYTCFIFTPEQVERNPYKSYNAIQFMIHSLEDLAKNIENNGGKLITLYGKSHTMVQGLIRKLGVDAVFFNRDYSPYAKSRDAKIAQLCERNGIPCITKQDYYLYDPDEIHVGSSTKPYTKYTPFYEHVIERKVEKPVMGSKRLFSRLFFLRGGHFEHSIDLSVAKKRFLGDGHVSSDVLVEGGRPNALKSLKLAVRKQQHYSRERDFFVYETTFLSAALKFGCISVREMYWTIREKYGLKCGLLRELVWRDFFAHILNGFPDVIEKGSFAYKNIQWSQNQGHFSRWKRGETGFPLVDACMRQLNATGYMHNRGRMLVATFLCKTLLINWRWGEQYFAQKLTDYDPASNNGNWQSISSTGVDRKPYFRDMSPWIQMRKFDGDAEFIRRWVEELREVDSRDIMNWDTAYTKYPGIYLKPMVDYSEQKEKMMAMYRLGSK